MDDDVVKTLRESGLSKVEADTYLAIVSYGPVSVGKIAKITNNYRPNTYHAVEKLLAKGFISQIQGKRSPQYESLSPTHLLNEMDRKRDSLARIVPALKLMKSSSITSTNMRLIEGVSGWKNLLDEFIEIGKERVVYGIPKEVKMLEGFFEDYHKKRAVKKISLRHLFNHDAKDRIAITKKLAYTKSRYLPKELDQPVSTSVCGNLVALTVYSGKNITTILIENRSVADAYRSYFEFLWKLAKS